MKYCPSCKTNKDLSAFRQDRSRKDGKQVVCTDCLKLRQKEAYHRKYKNRVKDRRQSTGKLIKEYKQDLRCEVCGETEIVCLDFHHRDESEKSFGISNSWARGWTSILSEIQKCICVCANCHRKIHAGIIDINKV